MNHIPLILYHKCQENWICDSLSYDKSDVCFPKLGKESDQDTLPLHLGYVVVTQDWAETWEHAAATTAETDISQEELLVDNFIILLKMHIK